MTFPHERRRGEQTARMCCVRILAGKFFEMMLKEDKAALNNTNG